MLVFVYFLHAHIEYKPLCHRNNRGTQGMSKTKASVRVYDFFVVLTFLGCEI